MFLSQEGEEGGEGEDGKQKNSIRISAQLVVSLSPHIRCRCSLVADEGKKKKKKKRGGGIGPRKKETGPTKVVISKTNRNKRKFVTSVIGLETVPDLKVKNAAKLLGRHFACGASASEIPSGAQEVVIQGDVMFDLPDVLVNQLNVSATYGC